MAHHSCRPLGWIRHTSWKSAQGFGRRRRCSRPSSSTCSAFWAPSRCLVRRSVRGSRCIRDEVDFNGHLHNTKYLEYCSPGSQEPACQSTGRRCGDGATKWRPLERKKSRSSVWSRCGVGGGANGRHIVGGDLAAAIVDESDVDRTVILAR